MFLRISILRKSGNGHGSTQTIQHSGQFQGRTMQNYQNFSVGQMQQLNGHHYNGAGLINTNTNNNNYNNLTNMGQQQFN